MSWVEFEQIIKLVQAVSESSLDRFEMKDGDFKLTLGKAETKIITAGSTESVSTVSPAEIRDEEKTEIKEEGNVLTSVLVGVFYDSPSPEAESFVKVGDAVKKGQVLGIIEAMKLMNEIECETDGVITEILVKNGDMVEYGQPLFRIK